MSNDVGYTGHQSDIATGLIYMQARYYDPVIGRSMAADPVQFVASNPASFNRYLYVNDNPYKYNDPDGEFLNFAIKFAADVALNVAVNYVTTSEANIGSALADSAVGMLNPASTLKKAQRLRTALIGKGKGAAPYGGDRTIFRQGTSRESPTRLNRKAQEAENSSIGIHGVSGSTTKTPGCSSASCSDLEAAGFKVHDTPTGRNPNHVTIELPKPVTKEDARRFNDVLERD